MKLKCNYSGALILFLFFIFPPVFGQNGQNYVQVQNNKTRSEKGKIEVDFEIILKASKITTNEQMVLTPVIKGDDGKTLEFPPVIVNGKKRTKLYKRSLSLNGLDTDPGVYSVISAGMSNVSIPYKTSVFSEEWMKQASFYLEEDLCGCAGAGKDYTLIPIADRIKFTGNMRDEFLKFIYGSSAQFIVPPKEPVKKRNESGEAHLIFNVAKWDILPDLGNNLDELIKIRKSLDYVKEEPTAKISSISIRAYASPEGPFDTNMELSRNRAEALRNYIQKNSHIPSQLLSSEGMGEDWDGLTQMIIADSQMESKQQVLNIIRNTGVFDGREKQLMDLSGGRPFHYMEEHFFPRLRRSNYKIEYTVPSFSMNRAKELLQTKPGMLSLEEMYLIANTYERGSKPFNEVFSIAQRIFPQDKIANLNVAAVHILQINFEEAKSILEKYKDDPDAWNNLGLIYMNDFDFDTAESYFQKANSRGVIEAENNLIVLGKFRKAYQEYQGEK